MNREGSQIDNMAAAYNNIGMAYFLMENYFKALDYFL